MNALVGHLRENADYDIHPEFTVDAAFERFSIMLKDNRLDPPIILLQCE